MATHIAIKGKDPITEAVKRKGEIFGKPLVDVDIVKKLRTVQTRQTKRKRRPGKMVEIDKAFFKACKKGDINEAIKWLERGADVNARNADGETALEIALHMKDVSVAKFLIDVGGDLSKIGQKALAWALVMACIHDSLEMVELLVKNGMDVNSEYNPYYPGTPLLNIACGGSYQVAKFLISKGANVNAKSKTDGETALVKACRRGHLEIVKLLIENGASVNVEYYENHYVKTPLIDACERGNLEIAKLLIENGADINVAGTSYLQTPLLIACRKGHIGIIQLLIDKGVDVNSGRDDRGQTALINATMSKNILAVQLLIQNGADVNATSWDYRTTPLMIAEYDVAVMLVESGADVNAKNDWGRTPLMCAAEENRLQVVRLLITRGAEINARDNFGFTALAKANQLGNTEVAEFLKKHGAKE